MAEDLKSKTYEIEGVKIIYLPAGLDAQSISCGLEEHISSMSRRGKGIVDCSDLTFTEWTFQDVAFAASLATELIKELVIVCDPSNYAGLIDEFNDIQLADTLDSGMAKLK
ncbi:MAG: hypothetical protein ABIH34_07915 [Nanoarchaeota archaeon]